MALPEVTSREQWLKARKRLLADEKELTEAGTGTGCRTGSGGRPLQRPVRSDAPGPEPLRRCLVE
jgi:Bacterial protein of unknown function (DUF899)